MRDSYDLLVVGSGSAGSGVAYRCAKAGWSVAQIDERPFGGTCALRGCDPKKILVGAAEVQDWSRRMRGQGISSEAGIDWKELIEFKRSFTDPVPENREEKMREAGITPIRDKARFVGLQSLQVADTVLTSRYILLANGAIPAPLNVRGSEHLTHSDDFLELEELPERICFIGGGYISFEFAHVAARAGATAIILHRSEDPLGSFDSDLVEILIEEGRHKGIEVHLQTEVQAVDKKGDHFRVTATHGGKEVHWDADLVVHGAGRVPAMRAMDPEVADVELAENGGVRVNRYLQSVSNAHVYAAGDVASTKGKPLTPLAGFESKVVAANLLEGNHRTADYPAQPSVVFTVPPLAMVGLTEEEANGRKMKFEANFQRTDNWYSSRRTGEAGTAFKTLLEPDSGRILGAHLLGNGAPELINVFALAINHNLTADDLKEGLYAYPTHTSDIAYML